MPFFSYFYILLAILVLSKIRYNRRGFNEDYLSFETTNAIKGVFISLVFIKHVIPYILKSGYEYDNGLLTNFFVYLNNYVGQWIVVMFLFYSGYGVMESIKKKGGAYVKSIPRKRILSTLINFDVAVLIFAIIALIFHTDYPLSHYLFSLIGWKSIGNSNWYIFVILLCYLIAFLSFRKEHNISGKSSIYCMLLLLVAILVLSMVKQSWWYDTMLCFGVGVLFSQYKNKAETFFKKYYWKILIALILLMLGIRAVQMLCLPVLSILNNVLFSILIVLLTMKIKVNNRILVWLGSNLFPLYIYQRVPMIVLLSVLGQEFVVLHPVIYITISLIVTLMIAFCYKWWAVTIK